MTTLGTSTSTASRSKQIGIAVGVTVALGLGALYGATGSSAKGGTAKPPANPTPPALVSPSAPFVAPPVFTGPIAPATVFSVHQFDLNGIITAATVSGANCPTLPAAQQGGTAVVNGITVTIPCNTILQMPAATFTWAELNTNNHGPAGGANALPVATTATQQGMEAAITGNIVNGQYIAGLVTLSQEALNSGTGTITGFDFVNGTMFVADGKGATVRIQLNDPVGRFSKGQSPDDRFAVDDENPTIHAGTGYPMCIPRTADGTSDPLCPQKNRPVPAPSCRNFTLAGMPIPTGGELTPPAAGQAFCSSFVMSNPALIPVGNTTTPDARQQAPFEVGDVVTYAGTLLTDAAGPYISAHTVEANVGIFTQGGTQPVYLSIGEFGVGAADPSLTDPLTGVRMETQDRIFLEAAVSDPTSVVDIYLIDKNPGTGADTNRWITPQAMTGENNGPNLVGTVTPVGGGITTMMLGAQPVRARLRATKAPLLLLNSPTRYLRVVARQHCSPQQFAVNVPAGMTSCQPALDGTNAANDVVAANGIQTGQYLAPTFEFIFPENTMAGDPVVASNFWNLGFLVNGEGPGTGALIPQPW